MPTSVWQNRPDTPQTACTESGLMRPGAPVRLTVSAVIAAILLVLAAPPASADDALPEEIEGYAKYWGQRVPRHAAAGDAGCRGSCGSLSLTKPGFCSCGRMRNMPISVGWGIMYTVWNKKILRSYEIKQAWQTYDGPNDHTGHMQLSLSPAGADKRTSFWKR